MHKCIKERIIYQSYDGYLIAVRHCIKIDMCLLTRFVLTYILWCLMKHISFTIQRL